ncbi:MAG: GTP-binding protein [Phycisphaerales bacterium]|jgi:tRNA modification GTPase|nr:GTP-binding protein [Phycisphaerales bacterium]
MWTLDDTIAAISSPPGQSRRTIVRLSGPDAIAIACGLFAPDAAESLSEVGAFRCASGRVTLEDGLLAPGSAYVFRAPRSYTRQDLVELHLPGSNPLATATLGAALERGARQANAGEFTARAFLTGRIDLSAAEAVADIIAAGSDSQLRSAQRAAGGELQRRCATAATTLTETLALVEASIDMAEEGITLAEPADLATTLRGAASALSDLAASATDMPDASHLPRVVLAGRPNAGKSSILNCLLGRARTLVSDLAGTTRDVVCEVADLDGAKIALLDAAGFLTGDIGCDLDLAAHQAALAAVAEADLILHVLDATTGDDSLLEALRETNPASPILTVCNKSDLATLTIDALMVSAETGEGLDALKIEIRNALAISPAATGEALGLHRRQKHCLVEAVDAVALAAGLLDTADHAADVAELVGVDLREALRHLGQISGEVVTDDLLGIIFSRFCVGK